MFFGKIRVDKQVMVRYNDYGKNEGIGNKAKVGLTPIHLRKSRRFFRQIFRDAGPSSERSERPDIEYVPEKTLFLS